MDTPTLTTDRLLLRPVTMKDIEFIYTLFAAPETNQYSSYDDLKTREEAKEMYETYLKPGFPTHFRLLIELKDHEIPLGTLGFYLYSEKNRRVELGYDLAKEHWGKGYMTEAVTEVLRYGFMGLELNRVEATVDYRNNRSIKLLERVGFKREGLLRQRHYYGGSYQDELFYGLLKTEYEK